GEALLEKPHGSIPVDAITGGVRRSGLLTLPPRERQCELGIAPQAVLVAGECRGGFIQLGELTSELPLPGGPALQPSPTPHQTLVRDVQRRFQLERPLRALHQETPSLSRETIHDRSQRL